MSPVCPLCFGTLNSSGSISITISIQTGCLLQQGEVVFSSSLTFVMGFRGEPLNAKCFGHFSVPHPWL